jgi:hypothetical protein
MVVSNLCMRTIPWRWTFAFVQFVFAVAALVYAPYEFRAGPHPIGDDFMMVGYRKVWPPPILRTCYALNFPALTAVVPFRFWGNWSRLNVVRYEGHPSFSFSVEDCMFLTAVFALWYWLGNKLDQRKTGSKWSSTIKIGTGHSVDDRMSAFDRSRNVGGLLPHAHRCRSTIPANRYGWICLGRDSVVLLRARPNSSFAIVDRENLNRSKTTVSIRPLHK